MATLLNESFEEAYEQVGKQVLQSTLINAITGNYDSIERQFLEFFKTQFVSQTSAQSTNERAKLDGKYKINQKVCPAYLYLVFCVSCNLSGCVQYQSKFTELLQEKYGTGLGRVTPDDKEEAKDKDTDSGEVLNLQQALTQSGLDAPENQA